VFLFDAGMRKQVWRALQENLCTHFSPLPCRFPAWEKSCVRIRKCRFFVIFL